MNTVKTKPEFSELTEQQVNDALDAYDESVEEEHSSCGGGEENTPIQVNRVFNEVSRLIRLYTERLETLIEEARKQYKELPENLLADILSYDPQPPIEKIAFNFVVEALFDESEGEE